MLEVTGGLFCAVIWEFFR